MSKKFDRELGMRESISRRDVLHGFGAAAAATFVPGCNVADDVLEAEKSGRPYYPPGLTGMRGNHDGSWEVAHKLAREGVRDWGPVSESGEGVYDLVVVGAGISGLAAAHYYLQDNPQARILLIENHDDFGGHAKRNEFTVGDNTVIGYGGSQSIQEPNFYPQLARDLLRDLQIDIDGLAAAYDQDWFKRHDLAAGIHFNKDQWGVDRLLRYELGCLVYLPLATANTTPEEAVAQMPMSDAARAEMLWLLTNTEDKLQMSPDERDELLFSISYREYLEGHLGIAESEVFAMLQDLAVDLGAGIEAVAAGEALGYAGLPGGAAAGHSGYEEAEPYVHHFPDGNASVARLLVRKMIPGVAEGTTFEDVVAAQFDYAKLDTPASKVRLRLNSTVVRVQHDGDPQSAKEVGIDYILNGKAHRVRAKHCVLACYNNIIPSLCPELPDEQREALSMAAKYPILYTKVMLRNWRAFKQAGIGAAVASGNYHPVVFMDFPVSFGGQKHPDDPDQPVILNMEKFLHAPNSGLPTREQRRIGRHELLATPFETMERNIRTQLASMLAATDFDPARDIDAITVNRWAHGYSDGFYALDDPWFGDWNDPRRPNIRGRQPFGRITIANSDAGGSAMLESAVREAHRAINELN